eukprot:SAG11_NODE_1156_length_5658_cov_10.848174_2_plen_53_part_00
MVGLSAKLSAPIVLVPLGVLVHSSLISVFMSSASALQHPSNIDDDDDDDGYY